MCYVSWKAEARLQSTRTESRPTSLALIVDHRVINNVLKDLKPCERDLLFREMEVPLLVHGRLGKKHTNTC